MRGLPQGGVLLGCQARAHQIDIGLLARERRIAQLPVQRVRGQQRVVAQPGQVRVARPG